MDSPAKTTAPGAQAGMMDRDPPGQDMLAVKDSDLMLHAYRGSGGFKDGTYLVAHRREDGRDYDDRRRVAHFDNFTRPVVDAYVDPIFRKQVDRSSKGGGEYFDMLAKDVDRGGTGIGSFMRDCAVAAQRDSLHFIAVSAPEQKPADAAQEMTLRPWAYRIQRTALDSVERDDYGRCVLVSWWFTKEGERRLRTLDGTGWRTQDAHGKDIEGGSGTWQTPRETAPVVMLVPHRWDDDEQLPTPRFLGVAKANHRVYNQLSELDEIERKATFPMLAYPDENPGQLTLGTNNVLGYRFDSSNAPAWISPDGAAAVTLANGIERNVQAIYRMANLSHAMTDGTKQASGVAKQLDRAAFDDALSSFAEYLSDAEQQLWGLFEWITGKNLGVSVSYPSEFTSAEIDAYMAAAASALTMGAGETFAAEIRRRVARLMLPDAPPDVLAAIDKEIRERTDADNQDRQPPPGNDDDGRDDDEGQGATE